MTYLNEVDLDIGKEYDLITYSDARTCDQSTKCNEAMINKLNSIEKNDVGELVELQKGFINMLDASGSLGPN